MKKLLYALPGSLIIFSAVFATHFPLAAAEKKQKARPVTIYTQSEFKLSSERMKIIDDILQNALNRNLDLTREATITLLDTEISGKMPFTPTAAISNKNISQFATEARKLIRDNATYTAEMTNLRTTSEKEAIEKYPLAKPRSKVKFQFQKGPYIETVDGIFYGAFERYVQIDGKRIPYVDLPDKERAMFDRKFNAEKRKAYVNQKIQERERQKNREVQEKFTELLAGQDILNEKNGYIYDRNLKQWITAKDYFQRKLPATIEKYQNYLKEQQEKERRAKELAASQSGNQATLGATEITPDDQKQYEKYQDAAKEKRKKLQQKYSGVDAYQGFRNALWGATREEVAYLFSKIPGARYEQNDFESKLTLPRYFPAEVIFHFDLKQLISVVLSYGYIVQVKGADPKEKAVTYRLFSSNDFNSLVVSLHDICGLSEEEKLASNKNLFKEIANGTLKPEQLHPQADLEYFYFDWIGQETEMRLSFYYDPQKNIYQDVKLTKKQKEIRK